MSLFVIHCVDKADSLDLRMATRAAHLDYARANAANILVAGPLLKSDGETMAGSMFILEGESLAAVEMWAANDPYNQAGLFERVSVHPYKWTLGEGKR